MKKDLYNKSRGFIKLLTGHIFAVSTMRDVVSNKQ